MNNDRKWQNAIKSAYDITTPEGIERYKKDNAKRIAHEQMIAEKNRQKGRQ